MKFRPLRDLVLIEPIDDPDRTAGGIVIPDTAKKKPGRGLVVACGPGRQLESGARSDLELAPGCVVLMHRGDGIPLELGGGKFFLLHVDSIFGVFEDPGGAP